MKINKSPRVALLFVYMCLGAVHNHAKLNTGIVPQAQIKKNSLNTVYYCENLVLYKIIWVINYDQPVEKKVK